MQSLPAPTLIDRAEDLLTRFPVFLQLARFVAIGVINYAIDTIIFNLVSKHFGVSAGSTLGLVNIPGFVVAVIQSYVWNHYWAFGTDSGLIKNFIRLFFVGGLGFLALLLILLGAKASATSGYYLIILVSFVIAEIILWANFGLKRDVHQAFSEKEFISFIAVSVVGLLINSFLLAVFSNYLIGQSSGGVSVDLLKNVAKILATFISLIWNFVGYKLVVFRK